VQVSKTNGRNWSSLQTVVRDSLIVLVQEEAWTNKSLKTTASEKVQKAQMCWRGAIESLNTLERHHHVTD
jgi:hypothetical protein